MYCVSVSVQGRFLKEKENFFKGREKFNCRKFEISAWIESVALLFLQHKHFYNVEICCCISPSFVWDKLLCVHHRVSSLKKPLTDCDKRFGVPRLTKLWAQCLWLPGTELFVVPNYALIQKHLSALYFRSTDFKNFFALKIKFHISIHIELCCLPCEYGQMVCRKETPPICSEFQFSESIICLALVRSQLE